MITPILPFYNLNNYKRQEISFQGKDLLKLTSLGITKKARSAIRDETNIIGKGGEGIVYKIPKSKYCVKITGDDLFYFGNWNINVQPHEKVNHVVAIADNGTRMMTIIEGQALNYKNNPEEVYCLPSESYITILKQITKAKKYGKFFDNSPYNIIYNAKQKTLTAIDFTDDSSFNEDKFEPISQLFDAMRDNEQSIHALKRNRQLIARLLNIVLEIIPKGNISEFPIFYDDINSLFEYAVKELHPATSKRQYSTLKRITLDIVTSREEKKLDIGEKEILNKKIKSAQKLIDKVLLSE